VTDSNDEHLEPQSEAEPDPEAVTVHETGRQLNRRNVVHTAMLATALLDLVTLRHKRAVRIRRAA